MYIHKYTFRRSLKFHISISYGLLSLYSFLGFNTNKKFLPQLNLTEQISTLIIYRYMYYLILRPEVNLKRNPTNYLKINGLNFRTIHWKCLINNLSKQ